MAKNMDDEDNRDNMGLSEDELAALEADDDDLDALKDIAGDDDDDDDTDGGEDDADDDLDEDDADADDDETAAAAEAVARQPVKSDRPAASDADPAAQGDDDGDVDGDGLGEFQSSYTAEAVENFDARMQEFADSKKALRAQLANGDIDMDAYEDQRESITVQEQALREQNLKAVIASEQAEQAASNRWKWEQERFFADKTNAIYTDALTMGMLDMAVKQLAQDPKNAARTAPWFLAEADKMVRERTGATRTEPAKVDAKKETEAKRKPDLSKVPKTLADLPAAELNDTGTDEFAHLDKLTGMKLEAAIAKMSPAQQARYLGGSDE